MITIDFTGDFINFIDDVSKKYNLDYSLAFVKVIDSIYSIKYTDLYLTVLKSLNNVDVDS